MLRNQQLKPVHNRNISVEQVSICGAYNGVIRRMTVGAGHGRTLFRALTPCDFDSDSVTTSTKHWQSIDLLSIESQSMIR
jgi:hypothetical protein